MGKWLSWLRREPKTEYDTPWGDIVASANSLIHEGRRLGEERERLEASIKMVDDQVVAVRAIARDLVELEKKLDSRVLAIETLLKTVQEVAKVGREVGGGLERYAGL